MGWTNDRGKKDRWGKKKKKKNKKKREKNKRRGGVKAFHMLKRYGKVPSYTEAGGRDRG